MSWLYLLIAGLLEVLGVIWLNQYARSKQKILYCFNGNYVYF